MGVFNALEFDGINSLDYGVYITGEAVFNSPQRAVEAVTVPGRNGDVLLDLGRYENIEVTYHAGVFGVDQDQFAKKIRAFRNMLASKVGYKRIVDTYNPTEYRLGTFVAPVDVAPTSMNRHGEFDIVFNCKPQRFLMDGESAMTVTDGQNVFNPTPFDAQPLLEIEGYGTIEFNGYEIEIENATMGDVILNAGGTAAAAIILDTAPLNTADTITFNVTFNREYTSKLPEYIYSFAGTIGTVSHTSRKATWTYKVPTITLTYGTGYSDTISVTFTFQYYLSGQSSPHLTETQTVSYLISYNGDQNLIFMSTDGATANTTLTKKDSSYEDVIGHSTLSILGDPTYIDCELGEAYMINGGEYVSLNQYIDLGSDLPTLAPGNNEFTFDDSTMTEVKIVPRWWIL